MILGDIQAETNVTTLKEAREMGATALFGEKYGDQVRMVKMGPDSIELCGGTHVSRTSQIGMLKILSESSIGAGLRRIEAVTGSSAMEYVRERDKLLGEVAEVLKTSPAEAPEAAARMAESLRAAEKQLERLQRKTMVSQADEIAGQAVELKGINLIAARVDAGDVEAMSALADSLAKKLKSVVIVLGGPTNGKVAFVGKVTPDLVQRGFHAGNLIREVAKVAGGGGGGRPDFAQAGGKDANKLDEALAKAREIVEQQAGA
jgi:alanyl-tRNA synthetase